MRKKDLCSYLYIWENFASGVAYAFVPVGGDKNCEYGIQPQRIFKLLIETVSRDIAEYNYIQTLFSPHN